MSGRGGRRVAGGCGVLWVALERVVVVVREMERGVER